MSPQRRSRPNVDPVPVAAARHPVLFVNPHSGGGKAERAGLADRARERSIEPVTLKPGDDLETLVRAAIADGADAIGVAGGDGSLALVATTAAAHDLPFVCIPAGTRNHFARDAGIAPDDLVGALDAFGRASERTIDVGYVNGRPFLNNVSLGIYGDAVKRAGYRDAKLRTLLATAEEVLGPTSTPPELQLVDDRGRLHRAPAVVLVSNNPYVVARSPAQAARPVLDGGRLGILVIDAPTAPPQRPGHAWSAPSLRVEAEEAVTAGIDGEAVTLAPPLDFRSDPGALRVRLAPAHARRGAER